MISYERVEYVMFDFLLRTQNVMLHFWGYMKLITHCWQNNSKFTISAKL